MARYARYPRTLGKHPAHRPIPQGPQLGQEMALPEKRPEIVAKMIAQLDREGAFRKDFSNGEFISSSLCIGRTFKDCWLVVTLDAPGSTVHFDPELKVYWRRGGSFD